MSGGSRPGPGTLLAAALAALLCALTAYVTAAAAAEPPRPSLRVSAAAAWSPLPGSAPTVTVSPVGSMAVAAGPGDTLATIATSDAAVVRPIASVAKTMTALVLLDQHPLAPGAAGPAITITAVDVADYRAIAAHGGSVAPVSVGEVLSERQLLLALMLPSANNLALTAARWAAGTVSAFVARLDARAASLGMRDTHFADPDGLSAATTSTAADLLRLAAVVVATPALVEIVSTRSVTLPGDVVLPTLDRLLETEPGWIGIKTGWTPEAGGCLLFAARRTPPAAGVAVTVVGAVLGQPPDAAADPQHPELGTALRAAAAAVDTAVAGYRPVTLRPDAAPLTARLAVPWSAGTAVIATGPAVDVVLRGGDAVAISVVAGAPRAPVAAGTVVGTVLVTEGVTVVARWALVAAAALPGPDLGWRLANRV